jgi:hypothetical protein
MPTDATILASYISASIAVIAACVAYAQVAVMRRSARAELLVESMHRLNDEQFRKRRRQVYGTHGKALDDWSEEEKDAADYIGPVYSELGFLVKNGYLDERAFVRHFGGQFIRAYLRLEEFLKRERISLESANQWIYFEWLARKAYLELSSSRRKDWWEDDDWRKLRARTSKMADVR